MPHGVALPWEWRLLPLLHTPLLPLLPLPAPLLRLPSSAAPARSSAVAATSFKRSFSSCSARTRSRSASTSEAGSKRGALIARSSVSAGWVICRGGHGQGEQFVNGVKCCAWRLGIGTPYGMGASARDARMLAPHPPPPPSHRTAPHPPQSLSKLRSTRPWAMGPLCQGRGQLAQRTFRKPLIGPRTLTCPVIVTCAFRTCRPVTCDTTTASASLFGTRVPALQHRRWWQEGCSASSTSATSLSCTYSLGSPRSKCARSTARTAASFIGSAWGACVQGPWPQVQQDECRWKGMLYQLSAAQHMYMHM